jgi:bifunctional non-homologous end joining protein LigD
MMTEDHPYDYAGFEGVIPAGNYGAGNVIIWDNGTWEFIEPGDDPVQAVKDGKLTFRMYGKKMFGEWALVKIKGRYGDKGNEWLLLKHRDAFANDKIDVTEVAPRSIISNRLVDDVSPKRQWQSNRPASAGGARTVAEKLRSEERAKKGAKPASSAKTTSSKKPAPSRPRKASSRAASSPSRSSPAGSPRKARPTARRRPR